MPKKAAFLFTLLMLGACFASYRLGATPVAVARALPAQENATALPPPALPAAPATWALAGGGGNGTGLISVTEPAVAGAQHVAVCITATYVNHGATAGSGASLELIDGNAGGSALLLHWALEAPNGDSKSINLCGLNVVGSVNTPMTLEIVNAPNAFFTVNLVGYDAL